MGDGVEHAQVPRAEARGEARQADDGGVGQIVGAGTRRSLLAAAAGAAGAFVAQALGRPAPADAANVILGGTNNSTTVTAFRNTKADGFARALLGRTTYTGDSASGRAVLGFNEGKDGTGIWGEALVGTGARGVVGNSREGTGVKGTGGHTGVSGVGTNYGVRGMSANNYGMFGEGGYTGVFGSGPYGTYGTGASAGAVGTSTAGYGVYGLGTTGVVGLANGDGYGVWGYGSDADSFGVVGQGGRRGVHASGGNAGLYATSGYVAVWANASTTSGLNYGVYSTTASQTQGWAGVFNGRVLVSGFLQKSGGGFQVDHPLEPATRYLVHSFVESPEMTNVYTGIAKLGPNGRAIVRLPRYFEAANRDHRYQLTAVGAAAPNLHVATKVKGNAFTIAGGPAGLEVCWQVTGVRQDAWAKANPIDDEPAKPASERGKYLNASLFGRPESESLHRLPEALEPQGVRGPSSLMAAPARPEMPATAD
jgi:hypothetical protein